MIPCCGDERRATLGSVPVFGDQAKLVHCSQIARLYFGENSMTHVVQIQTQVRIPYDPSDDGWYYHTNVFYADLDNPPDIHNSIYYISLATLHAHSDVVEYYGVRVVDPPLTGTTLYTYSGFNQPGDYVRSGPYSILQCVRQQLWVGDERVGYKLWRSPLHMEDIEGDQVKPGVRGHFDGSVANELTLAKITDRAGRLIDGFRTMPDIAVCGLRRGTRRRARQVFAV